ncbi:insulinase family protein [Scytonema sp. UIC 10036]|uniref:M16 family metallopeptidase n=1 Tax=Scytonema sp. UIC 10036 TaxID=2304196 RepID=UPI0012DA030C|nr:pitrilysin family protein [Scytonema sp. UIC 10036]MUH00653.1 insulinase family protein [Scytonema sp. UIC 10036]
MSVLPKFNRYRFQSLLLSVLITVLLLGNDSADSQLIQKNTLVSTPKTTISQETLSSSVSENVQKTLLQNGLTILTKEVHSNPVVTVQVWYKVGSRHEESGLNGIAHQLEHMLFRGTKNRPIQFGRLFSALGSDSNAFTSYDQTAYYNTAERDKLKALLILEADRMQNSVIDNKQLASEKRVVISELQGYENEPEYRLSRAVMQAAFPNHPYGLPVGGTEDDVQNFQTKQVQKYYQNFYSPDNAVLVIVGDFQTEPTLNLVKEIFGKIPSSSQPPILNPKSKIQNPKSPNPQSSIQNPKSKIQNPIVLQEPGATALLHAVYPLPDVNHPDVPALDVMDYILTDGRNARLYQTLVESGWANDVSASVVSLQAGGWYEVSVTASRNQDLKKIDSLLKGAISELINKGVTSEEVNRAKAQLEASLILGNRDITSLGMQLGNDVTTAGDYHYTERYLAAVRQVITADVQRVATKYLQPEACVAGFFEPTQTKGRRKDKSSPQTSTLVAENFSSELSATKEEVEKYLPFIDSEETISKTAVSEVLPEQFTLPNGLRVLLFADPSSPTVTLSGYIKAGKEFDPHNKAGLASLVAENLMNGTKTKDALTLAKVLDDRGASLDFETFREGVRLEGSALASDLPVFIQTLADIVKNATFPVKELELSRKQALIALKQELDDPTEVAERTFVQSLYPEKHPLHKFPTEKSLRLLKRQDVVEFKEKHYRPDTTVLALLGNFSVTEVEALIKQELGDWNTIGQPPELEYPKVSQPEKVVSVNPILPGKAQAITYMGNQGINRKDPRFYAALVLNQILGGDTLSSRLGSEVRDRQGLTYGIYSNFLAGKNSGTFLIEMQTSPQDTRQAIARTRELLQQIHQQGVTAEEIETAKRNLIGNYIVSLANPEELVNKILMNEVYGLDKEELRSFTTKIQAVSIEEVNQAARELLYPDKIIVVTAGPSVNSDQ